MTNEIKEFLKTAFAYKEKGNYKEAIDYFYKALVIDSESTEIMFELAELYSNLCQYDRAYNFYEQIISKKPDNYSAKYKYAMLLKYNKEYKKALELINQLFNSGYDIENISDEFFSLLFINKEYEYIIKLYSEDSEKWKKSLILYYVAMSYSALGQENTAREYYKKSFEVDKNNVMTGVKIGEMHLEKGQTDEAQQLALRLLKCQEHDKVFYLLAEISYIKNDIDSAIKYYAYAVNINSQEALYYFKLGIVYSLKGYFSEAVQSYLKAVALEPENNDYNYALAYLYFMINDNETSERIIDSILKRDKLNKDAIALKIILLTNKNEVAKAEKNVETLYKIDEKTDFIYYAFSVYYEKLDVWEKAIEAIKHNDSSLEYKFQLAKFYFNIFKLEESEQILKEIIGLNSKYIQAHLLLAQINLKNKKFDETIKNIENVLTLDKNNSKSYYILAQVYSAKCNFEKAMENYKIAAAISPNKSEYYAKIAECCYKQKNFEDAYYYYKEAANTDITNVEYRYLTAKCAENLEDWENASANYSIMHRLSPFCIDYNIEYALYLKKRGNKKTAVSLINTILKAVKTQQEKEKLKKCIDILKKKS